MYNSYRWSKISKKFKIPEGKVQVHILIDKELYRKVKEIAPQYYRTYRGAISHLIEEAIRLYLSRLPCTHTHRAPQTDVQKTLKTESEPKTLNIQSSGAPPTEASIGLTSRTMRVLARIARVLNQYNEVSDKMLNKIITRIAGGDKRTLVKYRSYVLRDYRFLEMERRAGNTIIYSVRHDRIERVIGNAEGIT